MLMHSFQPNPKLKGSRIEPFALARILIGKIISVKLAIHFETIYFCWFCWFFSKLTIFRILLAAVYTKSKLQCNYF